MFFFMEVILALAIAWVLDMSLQRVKYTNSCVFSGKEHFCLTTRNNVHYYCFSVFGLVRTCGEVQIRFQDPIQVAVAGTGLLKGEKKRKKTAALSTNVVMTSVCRVAAVCLATTPFASPQPPFRCWGTRWKDVARPEVWMETDGGG